MVDSSLNQRGDKNRIIAEIVAAFVDLSDSDQLTLIEDCLSCETLHNRSDGFQLLKSQLEQNSDKRVDERVSGV